MLDTHRFDLEAVQQSPGWIAEINSFESHIHHHDADDGRGDSHATAGPRDDAVGLRIMTESERFGISSFVYHARRPFHPTRLLEEALSAQWEGVLRTKGFFWLATRNDIMGVWQSAGGSWQSEPGGAWVAAQPLEEEGLDPSTSALWDPIWGDRCQQLVWIGIGMDKTKITAMLDGCLLTDAEMELGPEGWVRELDDPLPEWGFKVDEE